MIPELFMRPERLWWLVLIPILIGLYLGKSNMASSFGAVSSIIIVLVWIYYSAQILFFGAEFTKVYANRYGSHILTVS